MQIDRREPVQLGGSRQWIRIRAANARNPLLLLVQMGPGLPMINEARTFGRLLSLEDDFTVIYWDQRGCGRSLRSTDATRDLSVQAMVSDTQRLLAMLCDRFDTPPVVAGFSMGATIAALATARRPDLVAALVTVGMDIDGPATEENAYQFALTPRARGTAAKRSASSKRSGHHPTSSPKSSRPARGGPPTSAAYATVTPTPHWPATCWSASFAPPTTRQRTPSEPSGGSPRRKPRCCRNWRRWT
jgi:pimeloyl-ACP methyl ester carboxylesterase